MNTICRAILLALAMSGSLNSVTAQQTVVRADNGFAMELFKTVCASEGQNNVCISPASAVMALHMLYNGAAGETLSAMARALDLFGLPADSINQQNLRLLKSLRSDDSLLEVDIANSIWSKEGLSPRRAFRDTLVACYEAEAISLPFNPAAVVRINRWVSDHTKGKIPKIVDDVDGLSLILLNAIYFNGKWSKPFDKSLTKEQPFYGADGVPMPRQFMNQHDKYAYLRGDSFQAVKLPYAKGEMSMFVMLPDSGVDLREVVKTLTVENWNQWTGRMSRTPGTIALPRFRLEFSRKLNDDLTALGMGVIFEQGRADFRNMYSLPTWVDWVVQKTYMDVTEKGTEAAAVTGIGMETAAVHVEPPPFKMIVNRPFLCAIRDERSGLLLFMCAVYNPKQS